METAQEYRVAVRMEKSADGTTIVKAPVSEKKYLLPERLELPP